MKTQNQTEDDDDILKDGQSLRVPMAMMMDSAPAKIAAKQVEVIDSMAGYRPGSLPQTREQQEQRGALYDKANATLSARWKNPPSDIVDADGKPAPKPIAASDNAYAVYDKRMSERWRAA